MRLTRLFTLAPLFWRISAQDVSVAAVKQAFIDADIPSDLKINFDPSFLLEVILPQSSGHPILVHTGIQLPRNETATPPVFGLFDPFDPANPSINAGQGPFVIAAVDPDAPTPTNTSNAQVRHFLGGDFFPRKLAGSSLSPLLSNTTAALSEWKQPTPTGGNHRYVFLAFNQPVGFNQQQFINATTPIMHFDIATFAQEVGLGNPIAGTFMMVANPDNP
ncbi:PEBP-like protein [Macrolepiota fuliginosa MF-IS2]|uniref:PEBP-like protein n=1 Tax=Macrolepiota fuliginosa MF-IS2 TaxID=1400762 RepID=A0A9P5X8B2_9AGAR|nr:PEBP-like protein [Macrolepiota fuliginosa MF-IS2]